MANLIEILNELEKVRLAPVMVPVLKMVDPLMGSLPKGAVQKIMSRKSTRQSTIRLVQRLSPSLPSLVRLGGHAADSRLIRGLLWLAAGLVTPLIEVSAPIVARMVVPAAGPGLALASRLIGLLPPLLGLTDSFIRAELWLEKLFRVSTPVRQPA
ncbi:MAG: hypothetical protein DRI40_03980 [Chloroflexi bacterium]|nr:MAG: hypothetical protein DRI40_03980 [Chloroflexota bacterium]